MTRAEIVAVFEGIADIMQIRGDEPRRYQMYRWVARTLDTLQEDIHLLYEQNRLADVPGIGPATLAKIEELMATGQCELYEELKASIPAGVLDLMSIAGVGPSTAAKLYQERGIDSLDALQEALDNQKLRGIKGMGKKTEEKIRAGLEAVLRYRQYKLMGRALPPAEGVLKALAAIDEIREVSLYGGLRRRTETVTDVRIIAACDGSTCTDAVRGAMAEMELIDTVNDDWTDSGGSARLTGDIELHVKFITPEGFGSALIYLTGSEDHVAELNHRAEQLGLASLAPDGSAGWAAGKSEEEIYAALGLPFITPELRENQGEIQAALAGQLPRLVEVGDIRGELHAHSTWSDGVDTIEAMVEAAQTMGYEYLAVSDHSISSKIANGLSVERIVSKLEVIKEMNERTPGISILMGAEVDILSDGSLDYPDEILEKLDVVFASVHSGFGMDEATMTRRIIAAIENRFVHVLGHPTGRLLGKREPYQVNIKAIIDAAAENNTALEINAYPDRLDLKDTHARQAKERGVLMSISTDAHSTADLGLIIYGIYTARRGWLEKRDVLNALPLGKLMEFLGRKR